MFEHGGASDHRGPGGSPADWVFLGGGRRHDRTVRRVSGRDARGLPELAAAPRADYAAGEALEPVDRGLADVAVRLRALADEVPDTSSGEVGIAAEAVDRCLRELRGVEGAVAAVKSRVVGLASAVRAHEASGMASTDDLLRDRLGVSAREAKKQRQLARGLAGMDRARGALASGELGIEQANALGRAVRNGVLGAPEEVEQQLLEVATTSSPEQLNERIRRAEQAVNADALLRDENRAHAQRRASCHRRDDGLWQLHALLPPVDGEVVHNALRAFTTPDPADTPPRDRRRPEQRTADGLVALAAAAMGGGRRSGDRAASPARARPHVSVLVPFDAWCAWQSPGEGNVQPWGTSVDGGVAASGTGAPPDRRFDGPLFDTLDGMHGDATTVAAGGPGLPAAGQVPAPAGTGVVDDLPVLGSGAAISPEAAQRLLCDARITRIVMNARSQPIDVGRATRTWTPGLRAAVAARDRGCRGPGCDRPIDWCDIHHIRWWSKGGRTDLDNGLLLCHQHHRLVHEGGWALRLDPTTAQATFTDLDGRAHTTLPRGSPG